MLKKTVGCHHSAFIVVNSDTTYLANMAVAVDKNCRGLCPRTNLLDFIIKHSQKDCASDIPSAKVAGNIFFILDKADHCIVSKRLHLLNNDSNKSCIVRAAQRILVIYIPQHNGHDIWIGLGKTSGAGVLNIVSFPQNGLNFVGFFFWNLGQISVDNIGYRHNTHIRLGGNILQSDHWPTLLCFGL